MGNNVYVFFVFLLAVNFGLWVWSFSAAAFMFCALLMADMLLEKGGRWR